MFTEPTGLASRLTPIQLPLLHEHGRAPSHSAGLTQSGDVSARLPMVDVDTSFPPALSFPLAKVPHSRALLSLPTACHGTSVCYSWALFMLCKPALFPYKLYKFCLSSNQSKAPGLPSECHSPQGPWTEYLST